VLQQALNSPLAAALPSPANDASPIDMLLSRASVSPRLLAEPGPSEAQLGLMLDAALRAPDHGNLKPARFILVRGEARQRFGHLLAEALLKREPDAPEATIEKLRSWPSVPPLLIAVAAKIRTGHKIPEIEQILSAGAAAMNLLNAAHALGFTGMWVTGPSAYDPVVMRAMGLDEGDKLLGFIGIGTPANPTRPAPRKVDRQAYVSEWFGA
jgi:nitroreductase